MTHRDFFADLLDHPSEEVRAIAARLIDDYDNLDEFSRAWLERNIDHRGQPVER